MTNEGDGSGASNTPNVQVGKKNKKGKKQQQKGNEPNLPVLPDLPPTNPPPTGLPPGSLPPDGQPSGSLPPGGQPSGSLPPGGLPTGELPSNVPPPSDGQTSFQHNIVDESDGDDSEEIINVTVGHEWLASVERARLAVEILGQRFNGLDSDVKDLKEHSLEEVDAIRKELDLRKRSELVMKETITSLEFRFLDALTTIQTLKNKVEALEEEREVGATTSLGQERESRVEVPKPPTFKGVHDALEVGNFLWHLENYFRCNRVRIDANKINTAMLYLSDVAMLWWKRKDAEIKRGTRTIDTWEQFLEEFKKAFFPNNVVYEMKHKLWELKQTRSIRAYVKEFTFLTLQIPQLTEEDMLFTFMDGLKNWARTELERRQVKTIDEAITQAETLTDFKHDRLDKAKGKEARGSQAKGGGDRGRGREQSTQPKQRDTPKPDGRRFERQKYSEKRTQSSRGDGCYICDEPHGYARCPEMKSLSAIVRERKEKEAQDKAKSADTTQLGMVGICGAIDKQADNLRDFSTQYVDISINGQPVRAMVDSGAEANIMTKTAAEKLGLKIVPSNNCLKTINAPPTPVCGIAHGVSITLGRWRDKTNFTVAPLDISDVILGQEFFQHCHTMIDPYLQQLMVMEGEGSFMVPLVRVPKKDGYSQLSTMQIVKGLKKGAPTFLATIASSGEDHGAMQPLPPIIESVLQENSDVIPKELPKTLPPRREVEHMIELEAGAKPPALAPYRMAPLELEEQRRQLKELLEAGHIRPSKAPYGAPVLFQKKKDGSMRLCIDYRALNKITIRNKYPIPLIADLFDRLGEAKYFTKMDLRKGYYQDHVKNLKKVFKVLRENQLYVKREKCKFAQPKIHFLGHVISQGELRMDEAKKNRPWLWSEECEEAFEGLKAVVTEESVLMLPDFTKTFEIHTDASNFAIGGVLMQEKHPIAFESWKLNEAERR
nr:uncharacterized protein LOC104647157 [Solanum lycopersicum]